MVFDELTYEERGQDGKWRKPGKGNNEAFDLFCYAHAIAILRGYERIKWGDEDNVPYWAKLPGLNPDVIRKETTALEEETESAVEIEQVKPQPKPKTKSNWLNGGGGKKSGWL